MTETYAGELDLLVTDGHVALQRQAVAELAEQAASATRMRIGRGLLAARGLLWPLGLDLRLLLGLGQATSDASSRPRDSFRDRIGTSDSTSGSACSILSTASAGEVRLPAQTLWLVAEWRIGDTRAPTSASGTK